MPKRLIDGEDMWMSDKLLNVPVEFRAEYAFLRPLAEANGVFELNARKIWRTAYCYLRPEITPEIVHLILAAFKRAGLLESGDYDGKTWGWWVGIERDLPSESSLKRGDYKLRGIPDAGQFLVDHKPIPCGSDVDHNAIPGTPMGTTRAVLELVLDSDLELESGVEEGGGAGGGAVVAAEVPPVPVSSFPSVQEQTITPGTGADDSGDLESTLEDLFRFELGCPIERTKSAKKNLKELRRSRYSREQIVSAFRTWAAPLKGRKLQYPLSDFLRVYDGIISGLIPTDTAGLEALGVQIYEWCGQVLAGPARESAQLYLRDHPLEIVAEAFFDYVNGLDEFEAKRAVRDFFERGGGTEAILREEKRAREKASTAAAVVQARTAMSRRVQEEIAELEAQEQVAASLPGQGDQ